MRKLLFMMFLLSCAFTVRAQEAEKRMYNPQNDFRAEIKTKRCYFHN